MALFDFVLIYSIHFSFTFYLIKWENGCVSSLGKLLEYFKINELLVKYMYILLRSSEGYMDENCNIYKITL